MVIQIKDILINQRIEFYLNNTINIRPLTPHIMPFYAHKMASYSRHWYCDVTSPYVYEGFKLVSFVK